MEKTKEILKDLCSMVSVSGYEHRSAKALAEKYGDYFDNSYVDKFGNCVFVKKSEKENAPKLLVDAHFDEVGMLVSSIEEDGFLHISGVGGLDTRIFPAAEVTVYGKKEIYGVIASTPPHLQSEKTSKATPKTDSIIIDTGYTKEELSAIVRVGDPVRLKGDFKELANGYVLSRALDDKACVCAALISLMNADKSKLAYDVYLTVSAQEETGRCGASFVASDIKPDLAVIIDVNFARCENVTEFESIECGGGAGIDISALTDRRLTKEIMKIAEQNGIEYQTICEPDSTGTNNELVMISGTGVRTAVMSIPLMAMHTTSEAVCVKDVESLADILRAIYVTKGL